MNTTIFDLTRFQKVLKRHLMLKKRHTLWTLLGFTFGFVGILLPLVLFQIGNSVTSESLKDMADGFVGGVLFFVTLYFIVSSTFIDKDFKTRCARTSELMLPATKVEKYVVRVLYATLGMVVMILVALALADLLQQLVSIIVLHGAHASLLMSLLRVCDEMGAPIVLGCVAMVLWGNSLFLLGGLLFKKYAWAITILAIHLISILLNALLLGFVYLLTTYTSYEVYLPKEGWEMIWPCVPLAFTLFNYWLGYKLYARQQIINNRFFQI